MTWSSRTAWTTVSTVTSLLCWRCIRTVSYTHLGEPISSEQKQLISQLTDLGYSFDGLQTGYPGGEPDWHYVKELSGIEEKDLIKSFSKKGKPLVKKAKTFGIKLKK